MASEKALYWTAVGLVVLVLGNHLVSRYQGGCIANRSLVGVQHLSNDVSRLMAMTGALLGRAPLPLVQADSEIARIQTQFATMATFVAREQAACARLQAEQARMEALQQIHGMRLRTICPRQRLQVVIPQAQVRVRDGSI